MSGLERQGRATLVRLFSVPRGLAFASRSCQTLASAKTSRRQRVMLTRIVIGSAIVGIVLVIFFHNPTGGYDGQYTSNPDTVGAQQWNAARPGCAAGSLELWHSLTEQAFTTVANLQREPNSPTLLAKAEAVAEKRRRLNDCVSTIVTPTPDTENPFTDWRSRTPVIYWFAPVANVLWSIAAVLVIAIVALFVVAWPSRTARAG
jgi:hypothetical protein